MLYNLIFTTFNPLVVKMYIYGAYIEIYCRLSKVVSRKLNFSTFALAWNGSKSLVWGYDLSMFMKNSSSWDFFLNRCSLNTFMAVRYFGSKIDVESCSFGLEMLCKIFWSIFFTSFSFNHRVCEKLLMGFSLFCGF